MNNTAAILEFPENKSRRGLRIDALEQRLLANFDKVNAQMGLATSSKMSAIARELAEEAVRLNIAR